MRTTFISYWVFLCTYLSFYSVVFPTFMLILIFITVLSIMRFPSTFPFHNVLESLKCRRLSILVEVSSELNKTEDLEFSRDRNYTSWSSSFDNIFLMQLRIKHEILIVHFSRDIYHYCLTNCMMITSLSCFILSRTYVFLQQPWCSFGVMSSMGPPFVSYCYEYFYLW